MACEQTIKSMMWDLIIDFAQNIWGCDYCVMYLFCRKPCHYIISTYCTCFIEATVYSIRDFNCLKPKVAFSAG